MRFRHLAPIVLLVILGTFDVASACSCAGPDPPCGEYGEASAIFLGRVVGSAERKSYVDEKGNKTVYDVGRIRFLVQENFKGVTSYEVEIHSGKGGGDCGYWFLRNESYVVYAYRRSEDNKLYTNICTRTKHMSTSKEDLEFLRGVGDTKPGGTLYGRLIRYIGDREHGPSTEGPKMSGVKIAVKGAGQIFETVTNEAGEYSVTGLPAGEYDAFPQLPDNLGAIASSDMVDLFGSYSGVEMSEGTSLGNGAHTDEKGVALIKLFENYRYIVIASADRNNNKDVHADPIELLVKKDIKQLKFVLDKSGYGYEKVDALKRKSPKNPY